MSPIKGHKERRVSGVGCKACIEHNTLIFPGRKWRSRLSIYRFTRLSLTPDSVGFMLVDIVYRVILSRNDSKSSSLASLIEVSAV